jgi:hypothetical protein
MPDSSLPETLSWYRDSVKWTVGLSSAALLGAAAALDKIKSSSLSFQIVCGLFVIAGTLSLLFAGLYYFALTNFGNAYELAQRLWNRKPNRGEFNPQALETDQALRQVVDPDDLSQIAKRYRDATKVYGRMHFWTKLSLFLTVVLVPIVLIGAILNTNPPEAPKPTVPRYSVAISGKHRAEGGSMHVHTFLLSETTGEVWQMTCRGPERVEFVRVPVEGLPVSTLKTSP